MNWDPELLGSWREVRESGLTPNWPHPPAPCPPTGGHDCTEIAEKLLDCLGLGDPEVKHVRVKSVCVEVDLEDPKCRKDPGC